MTMTLWIVAFLAFSLPADYRLEHQHSEPVSRDIFTARHEFRAWSTPGGQTLTLSAWMPMALRDGGPMVEAGRWPVRVGGRELEVVETSLFMGVPQQAFVLYFQHASGSAVLAGRGYTRAGFEALLQQSGIDFVPATPDNAPGALP